MARMTFEIRVAGVVPAAELIELGAISRSVEHASTVLYGDETDEAALFGLLDRLRDLGLEVVEVRRLPNAERLTSGDDSAGGGARGSKE
jgi:hypothetical protein